MILCYTEKHVEEQLAICNFNPPLNRSHKVVFNYWLPDFNLTAAIDLAVRDFFAPSSTADSHTLLTASGTCYQLKK